MDHTLSKASSGLGIVEVRTPGSISSTSFSGTSISGSFAASGFCGNLPAASSVVVGSVGHHSALASQAAYPSHRATAVGLGPTAFSSPFGGLGLGSHHHSHTHHAAAATTPATADMLNPFMDSAHSAAHHLPHGALKLSPPHMAGADTGAAHSQGTGQYGAGQNGRRTAAAPLQ